MKFFIIISICVLNTYMSSASMDKCSKNTPFTIDGTVNISEKPIPKFSDLSDICVQIEKKLGATMYRASSINKKYKNGWKLHFIFNDGSWVVYQINDKGVIIVKNPRQAPFDIQSKKRSENTLKYLKPCPWDKIEKLEKRYNSNAVKVYWVGINHQWLFITDKGDIISETGIKSSLNKEKQSEYPK